MFQKSACVCVCVYHGLDTLDPNVQSLLLLQELFQVLLSSQQGLVVLGLRHFDAVKLRRNEKLVRRMKKNTQPRPCCGGYLVLVPFLGVLQVLLGHFVVLVADLAERVSQVGAVGLDLHRHLRVFDLLAQVIHLLGEPR